MLVKMLAVCVVDAVLSPRSLDNVFVDIAGFWLIHFSAQSSDRYAWCLRQAPGYRRPRGDRTGRSLTERASRDASWADVQCMTSWKSNLWKGRKGLGSERGQLDLGYCWMREILGEMAKIGQGRIEKELAN